MVLKLRVFVATVNYVHTWNMSSSRYVCRYTETPICTDCVSTYFECANFFFEFSNIKSIKDNFEQRGWSVLFVFIVFFKVDNFRVNRALLWVWTIFPLFIIENNFRETYVITKFTVYICNKNNFVCESFELHRLTAYRIERHRYVMHFLLNFHIRVYIFVFSIILCYFYLLQLRPVFHTVFVLLFLCCYLFYEYTHRVRNKSIYSYIFL